MSQDDEGFTLIDTLAALVILALSAGAFYRAMEIGTQGARLAQREAAAIALAQSRLNEAVALGPQSGAVPSGQTADGIAWTTTFAELTAARGARPDAGVMRVDVRVTWRDGPARRDREITLTTLVAAKPP